MARFLKPMLAALGLTLQLVVAVPSDTPPPLPRQRVKAVEVSDWYSKRLTLHRRLSYATLPVFAFQWAAGEQIWDKGTAAPAWARTGHRIGAATVATVFVANTVTGALNLWESRLVPQGRSQRTVHAIAMLIAQAGFTWAGAFLSEQAETDFDKRALHRKVALTSMGITLTSGVLMTFLNK